ncbi:hypothetical protein PR048_003580 [Dryococelus australis]|uniref:Uncharacterized protein n=1 Tax=Dryococelus australis TaxID=614101 RepID=A0ABQ9ING1_9NEOP|nr:hypothetical protein PR048_003580 [Dryococelus australis]
MEQCRDARAGKREILEKTRRPAASSGTIPTCENPGATPPGIEPGSPWGETSRGRAVSPLASHQDEPCSIPCRVTEFSQVGTVPDDAVGRRVFSGISSTPRPPSFRLRAPFDTKSVKKPGIDYSECRDVATRPRRSVGGAGLREREREEEENEREGREMLVCAGCHGDAPLPGVEEGGGPRSPDSGGAQVGRFLAYGALSVLVNLASLKVLSVSRGPVVGRRHNQDLVFASSWKTVFFFFADRLQD